MEWSALVRAAMVGVARTTASDRLPKTVPATIDDGDGIERFLSALGDRAPEDAVLAMAAVVDQTQAVGRTLPRIAAQVEPPLRQPRSLCPDAALTLLEMILDGSYTPVLPAFIRLLDSSGHSVPSAIAPILLERGRSVSPLRPAIINLVGDAGRRLAAERPEWAYASYAVDEWEGLVRIWRATPAARRRHLLTQVRLTNPARGRDLLTSSWKREENSTRAQLIQLLDNGLHPDDEPFLEAALDDRDHIVRRKAAELLAKLPASRLRSRMAAAVDSLLTWTPDEVTQITVTPPTEISPALLRDGVPVQPTRDPARLQGAQISAILAGSSLVHWEDLWGVEPSAIVRAAQTSRWPRTLMEGWVLAAERQQDARWAESLLVESAFQPATRRCIALLSPHQFDSLLAAHTDWSLPQTKESLPVALIRRWPHAWTDPLAARWIESICLTLEQTDGDTGPDSSVKAALKQFSLNADPKHAGDARECWLGRVGRRSTWYPPINEAICTLDIRARVRQTLVDPGANRAT